MCDVYYDSKWNDFFFIPTFARNNVNCVCVCAQCTYQKSSARCTHMLYCRRLVYVSVLVSSGIIWSRQKLILYHLSVQPYYLSSCTDVCAFSLSVCLFFHRPQKHKIAFRVHCLMCVSIISVRRHTSYYTHTHTHTHVAVAHT